MANKKIMHWADKYAKQTIARKEKDLYVVESGITPSGIVHAGNFREIMTQDLVYKALLKQGVNAVFQYYWDDFDRFRKVPKNVPKEMEQYLGLAVSKTPDPWECHESYAHHFEDILIKEITKCGVEPKYIHSYEEYKKCIFAENIKTALEKTDIIKNILNEFRKDPLGEKWLPIEVYCEKCGKDTTEPQYLGEYNIKYTCECGHENTVDFRKKGIVKLRWRVDWPNRWQYYDVDFESSGKDHQTVGGSVDTGNKICEQIYNHKPPIAPMYEFIYSKGKGEKMSSSMGNVITVTDLLRAYEPEVIRYIYTARINRSIEIAFDQDLLNVYNYFDLAEKMYFGKTEEKDENEIRKYELSQISKTEYIPRVAFSVCANTIQVSFGNIDKALETLQKTGHLQKPNEETRRRLKLAQNWVKLYAPEDICFTVQEKMPEIKIDAEMRAFFKEAANRIEVGMSAEEIQTYFYSESRARNISPKKVFSTTYQLFLGKNRGPRLGAFLDSLEKDFVVNRLRLIK